MVKVHGVDWRDALAGEKGRRDWYRAERDFAAHWRFLNKVGPSTLGAASPFGLGARASFGLGAMLEAAASSGLGAVGADGAPLMRKRKVPVPRPWHLLEFRVPPLGSFQLCLDNSSAARVL